MSNQSLNKTITVSFRSLLIAGVIVVAIIIIFLVSQQTNKTGQSESARNTANQKGQASQSAEPAEQSFTPPERNFEGIQFADVRKVFDPKYNQLADELSIAYYDYWKKGLSQPWQGYDVQATPEESKQLFDTLQSLIWFHYRVGFHEYNLSLPVEQQIPEAKYNFVLDRDGNVEYKKSERAQEQIDKLAEEGFTITIP